MTSAVGQIGKLAVRRGWITEAQLSEAIVKQAAAEKPGATLPFLGEVLVQLGYLTNEQIQSLLGEQQKKIVQCPGCSARFNVVGFRPGVSFHCPKCNKSLVLAGKVSNIRVNRESPVTIHQKDDPLVGTTIGNFRVTAKLGQGGMGAVYRAVQINLDRPVALKILSADAARSQDFVDRFLREAKAAARFNHPNIVQVYDAGRDGERLYFAMEFVDGESLMGLVERQGPIEPRRAARWIADAGRAPAYAHGLGVIHRDIKPDNLLLTKEGQVKLADLGLAKVEDAAQNNLTMTGIVMGTPYYMSPEQAIDSSKVDARGDIYSLGATLYRLVTGTVPYTGRTPTEILVKIHQGGFPPPSKVRPSLPKEIDDLVACMMAHAPAARFQDASTAAAALDRFASTGEAPPAAPVAPQGATVEEPPGPAPFMGGRPETPSPPPTEQETTGGEEEGEEEESPGATAWTRRPGALAACAAVALALLGGIAMALRDDDKPESDNPARTETPSGEQNLWAQITRSAGACATRDQMKDLEGLCASLRIAFPDSPHAARIEPTLEAARARVTAQERADRVTQLEGLLREAEATGAYFAADARMREAMANDAALTGAVEPLLGRLARAAQVAFNGALTEVRAKAASGDFDGAWGTFATLEPMTVTEAQGTRLAELRAWLEGTATHAQGTAYHRVRTDAALRKGNLAETHAELLAAKEADPSLGTALDPMLEQIETAARSAFGTQAERLRAGLLAGDLVAVDAALATMEAAAITTGQRADLEARRAWAEERKGLVGRFRARIREAVETGQYKTVHADLALLAGQNAPLADVLDPLLEELA
ncbi:MAG: serine/threonine protein kinase, partial [Planctomycetes bacterium]|nr:serine/threonine protein kinase [Planctomycetota bacterium]